MKKYYFLIIGFSIICNIAYLAISGWSSHYDLDGHWQICNFAINGIDPYLHIGSEIDSGFSTVPWACILGNIFYLGFCDIEVARIYIWVLHWIMYILTAVVVYLTFFKKINSVYILLSLTAIGQFSFAYSLWFGNDGAIICFLVIIAICLLKKHPYISGTLFGLAMTKPQITAIILLVVLLNRNYKVITTAAAITILGWTATAIITNTGMITLLQETLNSSTSNKGQYLGLFSVLTNFGFPSIFVMIINFSIGIFYTIYFWRQTKHNELVSFIPACIASTFWIFKNGTDFLILIYVTGILICISLYLKMPKGKMLFCLGSAFYLQTNRLIINAAMYLINNSWLWKNIFKGLDGVILICIGIWVIQLWRKNEKSLLKNNALRPLN